MAHIRLMVIQGTFLNRKPDSGPRNLSPALAEPTAWVAAKEFTSKYHSMDL